MTFLLCFWEVQYGIMAGVLVSGILLLYSVARPPIKVLEQGVLLVQPGSSLHFPAADHLQDIIRDRALAGLRPLGHLHCSWEMTTRCPSSIATVLCHPGLPPRQQHRLHSGGGAG